MKFVELFQIVQVGPRFALHAVEFLNPGLEAKDLGIKGKCWLPSSGWDDFADASLLGLGSDAFDVFERLDKLLRRWIEARRFDKTKDPCRGVN